MPSTYAPLHIHSFYSLLDGLCSPTDIITRCVELDLPACAITDHGSISGMKKFYDAAKKKKIKPIIGVELYICEQDAIIKSKENNKRHHLIVLAKNDEGIKDLMELVGESNKPEHFYRKPRIHLEGLALFAKRGNLICLSACIAGQVPSILFPDFKEAAQISSQTEDTNKVYEMLDPCWEERATKIIKQYVDIFGKDNYYLELQLEGMAIQQVVVDCLRELGEKLGIKTVASLDAHYTRQSEAADQRILLCAQIHTTADEQEKKKAAGKDVMNFFSNDRYYIPSFEEMKQLFSDEELQTTLDIADRINYTGVGRDPCLPVFKNDEMQKLVMNSDQYLKHLCIRGAKEKIGDFSQEKKTKYWNQALKEMSILSEAGLSDYFLIEWDACEYVDKHNGPRGKGRGSGAGSVVNYFLNITDIDPIEYGLYFERFYNAARNIPPHFEAGHQDFMEWFSEAFEEGARPEAMGEVRQLIKRVDNPHLMKEEAEWITQNSPRMWQYLLAQTKKIESRGPVPSNVANSHIAHGLGITNTLDKDLPVEHIPGHISLPDIDTDVGVSFRGQLIEYLTERWGDEYVGQMITFGRLQGKAALKEVFRTQPEMVKHLMKVDAVKRDEDPNDLNIRPHDLCNEITQLIPNENNIADELKEMRKESGNDNLGVLHWAIAHIKAVSEAYGRFKVLFDQAMRLEGVKKNQSKHAAGVVISADPLSDLIPLTYDPKSGARVCGVEMGDAEKMGAVKYDFLGVGALDKLWMGMRLINESNQDVEISEEIIGIEND
jgi:DNA polymerase III alpha subunit